MTQPSTLLRSLAVTIGIIAAGGLSALAVHAGMSDTGGGVSISAKGAQVTHAPALATMQLGKSINETPLPLMTTTTAPAR